MDRLECIPEGCPVLSLWKGLIEGMQRAERRLRGLEVVQDLLVKDLRNDQEIVSGINVGDV